MAVDVGTISALIQKILALATTAAHDSVWIIQTLAAMLGFPISDSLAKMITIVIAILFVYKYMQKITNWTTAVMIGILCLIVFGVIAL